MKKIIHIALVMLTGSISALAQDQNGNNPPQKDPELIKIQKFYRNDTFDNPYTDEEVQKLCDYIKENPVVKDLKDDDEIPLWKIRVARNFYGSVKDKDQKKKLVDLMMNMFKEIQATRDALGVDPFDREEGWLYQPPTPPPLSKEERAQIDNSSKGSSGSSPRDHARHNKLTQINLKITHLWGIHGYLYQAMTKMKIPLDGIPANLERSPAEKARTKDALEKQAFAMGRKKPEPKAPETIPK